MITDTAIPTATKNSSSTSLRSNPTSVTTDDLRNWLPYLIQTVDPSFPTGGYAHSGGLEEMVYMHQVKDAESLLLFLQRHVIPSLQNLELPYLRFACQAASENNLKKLIELDHDINAWKLCHETRSASTAQGNQHLRMLRQLHEHPLLDTYTEKLKSKQTPGHQIVVFAIQNTITPTPIEATLLAWYYKSVSNFCTASLKLIRIGQEGCQKVLRSSMSNLNAIIENSLSITQENAGSFNPVLDIAAARHEKSFIRLFIS